MHLNQIPEYIAAKAAIDGLNLDDNYSYRVTSLLSAIAQANTEVQDRRRELNNQFPECYISTEIEQDEIKFTVNDSFNNREQLLAFVAKHSLDLPKDTIKSGNVKGGSPYTNVIHSFDQDGLHFSLSYEREGLPTKHCRIVANTYYDVACEVGGSDSGLDD